MCYILDVYKILMNALGEITYFRENRIYQTEIN